MALVVFDVLAHLNKKRETLFERIALVCFGVAVLAEVCAYPYSRRIDTLSEEARVATEGRIAALNKEAGDARQKAGESDERAGKALERASKADERASKNEKEAARLNKLAEDEKSARVALQKQLAWREPTDAQLNKIRDRLVVFRGQQFDVVTYASEPECLNLANRVYSVAIAGQWVLDPERKFAALFSLLSGIQINVSERSTQRTKDAATAFADSLSKEGISARVKVVLASDNPPRADLLVVDIGRNPASMMPVSLPR